MCIIVRCTIIPSSRYLYHIYLNMTIQEKLGKAIIQLRKEKNISQEAFAFDSGIDRRYMSDIENGKRNLSIDIIERISSNLGLKISELFAIAETIE